MTITSDDYSAGTLGPIWSVEGPAGTASLDAGGGDSFLEISVPAGDFDLFNSEYNATRVLQDAADTDFGIEASFLSEPAQSFQMQGILIEQDASNWIRFDLRAAGGQLKLFAATTTGAASSVRFDIVVAAGDAQFLRVTRTGDDWLMEYSADGTAWTAAGGFTHALTVTGVGPFAASTGSGGNGPGYTAQVDYFFNTAAPVVPEDPAVPNQAPTAAADALAVDEDGSATFDPAGNDNDPDGDAVVVAGVSAAPANGTAVLNADGSVTYTPGPDFHGPDAFDVVVTDGRGGFDTSTVSVTVAAVSDDPPVAADDTYQINVADGTVVADATTGVLANDLDPDGDLITASLLTGPTRGTLTFNADGSFDYTAGASFNGSDSFTYEISDPGGLTDTATVTIEDTNAPPALITSDDYSAGTLGPIWSVEGPAGTASLDAGGGDSFLEISVPAGDFDLFNSEYNATRVLQDAADTDFGIEASFLSEPAQSFQMQGILIEQDASNWIRFDLRAAGGQLKLFAATTTGAASSVRFDIVVAAGDAQFLRVTRTGDDWLMEYSADGTAWTAAGGFTHALTVTGVGPFAASTGSGGNGPGYTAQVDYFFNTAAPVVPEDPAVPNQAPTAAADALAVDEDGSATFDPAGNDNDPDGDAVVVAGVSAAPANGTAVLNADGSVTYTPGPDFHGPDAFDVVVTDGRGGFDTSTVSVTVAAVSDDPPVAADDTYQINVADGTVVADATTGVLANDLDPDGDLITASLLTGPTRGTLTFNADGSFDYTAGASFNGSDSFTYEISDPGGLTDTATVTIEDTNAPPQLVTGLSVFSKLVVNATMTATHAVAAADFDGDGDIDLVATAELDHTVAWFENDGSLGFTKHVIDGALSQAYPISIADIDGDGDVDVLAGGYGADQFVVYANDGLGNFTSQVVLSSNGAHSIFAFDVDGDGDQDLVTSSQDVHQAAWWENDGNENFAQHIIDGSLRRAKTAIPADIDGDGDVDIVGTSNASDQVVWYENDGSENFTKRIVDSNMDGAYYAIAADLDGDGDQDLAAVGQNADSIAWYRNDGSENFTKIVLDSTVNGARTVAATDIDGDGDIDLFATARDGNTLNWYQNDGDGNFTARFVDQNSDGVYGVEFSDINRDGLLDVLSAVRDTGEVVIHLQSKEHAADVTLGGTLQITTALLQATDPDDGPDDLTYTILTVPLAGEVRLDGAQLSVGGTFTQGDVDQNRLAYVHIDAAEVTDGFTFTLSDGGERGVAPANGSFTFNITSTPPDAVDDGASTDEDQAVSIDVLTNDSDSEGRAITIFSAGDPANGSVAIDDSGTPGIPGDDRIVYTPDPDFFGTDSFTYLLQNSEGGLETATVIVTVNPIPDSPVAFDDALSTGFETVLVLDVNADLLANDGDADGDLLGLAGITQPSNGTLVDNGDGTLSYTPDPDFSGDDTFTYTITDGGLNSAPATVTISVGPELTIPPPVLENGPNVFTGSTASAVVLPHQPQYLLAEGTWAFEFNAEVVSGRRFLVSKDSAGFDNGGHVGIYIENGDLVVRMQDTTSTSEVRASGAISAGVDYHLAVTFGSGGTMVYVDGQLLTSNGFTGGLLGNEEPVVLGANQWSSGDLVANSLRDPFDGTVSIVQLYDEALLAEQVLELAGGPSGANTPPAPVGDSVVVDEDGSATFDPLVNDSDADGDTLSVSGIATQPANGGATVEADGTVTYTPDADFNGVDSFEVSISDGTDTATSVVNVTVNPVNDDPVAVDDDATAITGVGTVIQVLANDIDVDGDQLSVIAVQNGANGTVSTDGTVVTYSSTSGFTGTDSFTYTIVDEAAALASTATVTVQVLDEPNTPPVAADDDVAVQEDGSVTFQPGDNDTDNDGHTVVASAIATQAVNGTAEVNPDGTVTYTPNADFNGDDSFEVTVMDGVGGFDTSIANVTVTPQNDQPLANDDNASTPEGSAVIIDVLGNDTDIDGDSLQIDSVTDPANGSVTLNANGTVTYTPEPTFSGEDSFSYTVTDGILTDTATVTVAVSSFPEPVVDMPGEMVFGGTAATVLEMPHAAAWSIPAGTLNFSFNAADTSGPQGLFSKDASGFVGGGNHFVAYLDGSTLTARFQNGSASAVLTVPGIVAGQSYDVAAVFGPGGSELYLDGVLAGSSPLVMDWTQNVEFIQWGGRGWASASGAPGFDAPFEGTISNKQLYDVALDAGQIAELHADGPPNNLPVAVDDEITVAEDSSVNFDPTVNDSDLDGDTLAVASVGSGPANGAVVVEADGTVTYTPDADFFGADSFEIVIGDGNGGFDTSAVNVTVTPVEDDPVAVDDDVETGQNTAVVIEAIANDFDADGDALAIVSNTDPSNGTVVDNGDGTFTYTPLADFVGADSFDYTISDGDGPTSTATVTLAVSAEPTFPDPVFEQPGVSSYSGAAGDVDNYAPDPALNIPEGTIAFSFIDDNPGSQQGLVVKDASGFVGGGNHFAAYIKGGDLIARFQNGSSSETFKFGVIAGQEYEVAAVFGSGGVQLWVDGTVVGENAGFVMDWTGNDEFLQVGGLGWGSATGAGTFTNPFSGQIADVEIYDLALDADQIATLAESSSFDL